MEISRAAKGPVFVIHGAISPVSAVNPIQRHLELTTILQRSPPHGDIKPGRGKPADLLIPMREEEIVLVAGAKRDAVEGIPRG